MFERTRARLENAVQSPNRPRVAAERARGTERREPRHTRSRRPDGTPGGFLPGCLCQNCDGKQYALPCTLPDDQDPPSK